MEFINDFSIHQVDKTITAQVKKRTLTISDINKLLQETYTDSKHVLMIVASHFHDDLKQLINKRNQFRRAMVSDLDDTWKKKIITEFRKELVKRGLGKVKELFIKSEFRSIPENNVDDILVATVWRWLEKKQIAVNIPNFLESLKVQVQLLRSKRGHLRIEDIDKLVQRHSVKSVTKRIIKEIYETEISKSPQILSLLGETQEDILRPLEEKLQVADQMLDKGNYKEALDIFMNLATFYPKEDIYLQCAILNELCDDYEGAIDYSNHILTQNPKHYKANLIKGTSLSALKRYSEAITQLEQTLEHKKTPEVHYNLAYTYWLAKGNWDKAIEHYKLCLKLEDNFTAAHLNISICYFEVMDYKMSLYHVNQAILLNPDLYQAYARKGELYRFLGLYDDAIVYFEECISRDETNYQSLLGLALCFVEKGFLSEAILQFTVFFRYYYDQFFKAGDVIGKKIALMDLGWKKTLFAIIELSGENQLNVHVSNICLPISIKESNDFIFIGSVQLSDGTGSILYPTIGKVYENSTDFHQVINHILNSVNLFQVADKPLYVEDDGNIQVCVKEREKYILIEIIFADKYQISGMTNEKSGGLEAFMDYFDEYGQYRIHLECLSIQEVFIIDGIKEIAIG